MTVTFCGHSEVARRNEVRLWLKSTVEPLISDGADTFYLGGRGGFDALAAGVMLELKKTYPHIQIVLVLAYLNKEEDSEDYDYTLYPGLEDVPPRFAISKRNERMVEMSDVVVAYVTHDWGGAAKTLKYAKQKKKVIYSFSGRERDLEKLIFPKNAGQSKTRLTAQELGEELEKGYRDALPGRTKPVEKVFDEIRKSYDI